MEIFAGLLQLTYITIQCILQVWIWREKFFSIFFQRMAIKEKMFDSFLLVATPVASWVVIVSYPTQMSVKLYVCSAQAKNDDLVLSFKKKNGILSVWL